MKTLLLTLGLGAIGCLAQATAPETVLTNGTIYSLDSKSSVFRRGEVSFANGTILCIGAEGACAKDATDKTRIVNLQGKTVLPGLIDAHAHPIDAGRAMLDRLNTNRPVMLIATNQHNVWLNTRGLRALNITSATANPPGGRIGKDANGFPTGVLEENAAGPARALSGDRGITDLDAAIAGLTVLRQQGFTTILNALATPTRAWKTLARDNRLTARIFNAFGVFGSLDFDAIAAQARNATQQLDDGAMVASRPGEFWRHVKFFVDGVLPAVSQSAMLVTPYLVNNSNTWVPGTNFGIPGSTSAQLEDLFTKILGINQGLHLHACGDAGVRQILTVAARMNRTFTPSQVAVAHAELVHPDDLAKFATLGVPAVMSYQWAQKATYWNEPSRLTLGPERMARTEPHTGILSAGGLLVYGSDWPVDPLDAFLALKVGVTRSGDASNRNSHSSFGPQFVGRLDTQTGLTREQALRGMTVSATTYLEQEKLVGSLEKGKFADIIVTDRDFLDARAVPDEELGRNRVLLTLLGGRPVWANATWVPQDWTATAKALEDTAIAQRLNTRNILPRSISGRQCQHGSHEY
ncbi:hypothetical protein QQZ08_009505 [Neonectria magnoliae]|uniref:Amidohydrolase 3 domain-containing protein n=1 Tax=Neonectria magnoliae TaxID=2732573 RepID=A0ABR1HML5_9HYPO